MSPKTMKSPTFDVLALVAPLANVLAPPMEGFLERIVGAEAIGWAYDPRRPERRVLVTARIGGRIVAEALADIPRADLEAVGKSNGVCSFRMKLPADALAGGVDNIVFECVSGLRRQPLARGARFAVQEAAPKRPKPTGETPPPRGKTVGFLERCVAGRLSGWAVDPASPSTPAAVDIFDGEVYLGAVVADLERPRLLQSGAPFGARGFEFELPEGRTVSAQTIRARLSKTRLELRRSRSYPADRGAGQAATSAPAPAPVATRAPERAQAVAAALAAADSERVVFLVCGADPPDALAATVGDCENQRGDTAVAVIASRPAGPTTPSRGPTWFGPDDGEALRAFALGAEMAVFLAPGQRLEPGSSARMLANEQAVDVLHWGAGDEGASADPDLALLLGGRSNGLAVRGVILAGCEAPLSPALADDGLEAIERWAARSGLTWGRVWGEAPAAAPAAPRPLPPPPSRACSRVSLAVWAGWDAGLPPAMAGLLAGAAGLDVEVLAPAALVDGLAGRLRKLLARGAGALSVRAVDAPEGEVALWRAMAEAATGQVVILCDGRIEPDAGVMDALAQWAAQPSVGVATAPVDDGLGGILAGLALAPDEAGDAVVSAFDPALAGRARPVLAAPAMLMAVARPALAEAGGFDALRWPDAPADLALGIRLRRSGRRTVLLGDVRVHAPQSVLRPWLRRPLDPARRALLGAAGAQAATDYPAPRRAP